MSHIERPRFSCVLGGALATISALPRVAPIVHAAQGCGGNLFMSAYAGSGYLGAGYCGGQSVPSSNIGESEIVFGGTDRLAQQIQTTIELIDADLFIIVTSCMTEIIADDVEGVVRQFGDSGKALFAIETGGFKGNSYNGYEKVMEGLFKNYIGKGEKKDDKLVNILGVVPAYDPFFRGDLEEIQRLLERLGLKVNTLFTSDQTIENLQSAGNAALNIVFSRAYGVSVADAIEQSHGIPYWVTDLPIGAVATKEFVLELAKRIHIEDALVEDVLRDEFRSYYGYLDRALDLYTDSDFQQYAIVVANANGAVPYTRYIAEEIGWIPKYVYITDILTPKQQKAIEGRFEELRLQTSPQIVFETDTSKIGQHFLKDRPQFLSERYYDRFSPAYVLGSSLEKDFAASIGAKNLSVSFPITNRLIVNRGYAGFKGGLNLFEDLVSSLVAVR